MWASRGSARRRFPIYSNTDRMLVVRRGNESWYSVNTVSSFNQYTMQDPEKKLASSQDHVVVAMQPQSGQAVEEDQLAARSTILKKVVFRALLGTAALALLSHQLAGHFGCHVSLVCPLRGPIIDEHRISLSMANIARLSTGNHVGRTRQYFVGRSSG